MDYDRYDRRSYSPSFRKMDSPTVSYKPDSTISDTELERQQQFSQMGDYYQSWNSSIMPSHSPRRPNLDDRINRMLSDSPTPGSSSVYPPYQDVPYPSHDNSQYLHPPINHHGFYYNESYPQNHTFIPPPVNMDPRYQQPMMNSQPYDEGFNSFPLPQNFVNNSNLVEITQQKREKQRVGSNQIAVQVGNLMEIVPQSNSNHSISTKSSPPAPLPVEPVVKPLSAEEMKQQAEKKHQARQRRHIERQRKRLAKHMRKEKLREEIQKYFDAGINIEDSDDESLIKLRPINVNAVAERGIIKVKSTEEEVPKKSEKDAKESTKKVLFKDGIMPGETSSDNEHHHTEIDEITKRQKMRRKRARKNRLNQLVKERKKVASTEEVQVTVQKQDQLDTAPPPDPPAGSPPLHLKQPKLKKITSDMFATFTVNQDPICFYIQKYQLQSAGSLHYQPRNDPRHRYHKHNNEYNKHPNNSQYHSGYPPQHQRYGGPSKLINSSKAIFNIPYHIY